MEPFDYLLLTVLIVVFVIVFNRLNKLEDKINTFEKLQKSIPLKKTEIKAETIFENKSNVESINKTIKNTVIESKLIPSESVFIREKINNKNNIQNKSSFEKFFADNILNKVGAVALILGLSFFLKYAFDNDWINEFTQLIIGYLISFGILMTGINMKGKQKLSHSLLGIGCAALFLTTYSGYMFYHIIPNALAFVIMSIISIFTIIISMNYNSRAIAFLGLFGGYITPLMMVTSQNVIGFLSYILFLNVILAYISYKKDWIKLQSIGLFTNLLWLSVFIFASSDELSIWLLPAGILIGAIWFVHFIADNLKNQTMEIYTINRFINPLFTFILLINLIKTPNTIGLIAIAFSLVYLATLYRKGFSGYKHNTIIGLIFILFSILKLTADFNTLVCLIAYSTVIIVIGVLKDKDYILNTGVSFLTFSFARLLFMENVFMYKDISLYRPFLTPRTFCFEAITIIGFCFGYYLDKMKSNNKIAANILNFLGAASLFTMLTAEINDYSISVSSNSSTPSFLDNIKNFVYNYIIIWSMYSLFFIKFPNRSIVFKTIGYCVYILTLLLLLFNGFDSVSYTLPILNIRVLAWILFIGVTCMISKWNEEIKEPFTYIALILGTLLIYSETTISLPDMSIKQLILSLSWLIYAIGLISIGILKNLKPQRYFAIGLILLVIIKIFFFDLAFLAQIHRIISFVVLGGLLLLTSYLYQKYAKYVK